MTDEPEDLDDLVTTPIEDLCHLLRESGAEVTFSINCCSGLLEGGRDTCRCWRCRQYQGEAHASQDDETEVWWAKIADQLKR